MAQGIEEYMAKSKNAAIEDKRPLISTIDAVIVGLALTALSYLLGNFATIAYVDAKYDPLRDTVNWLATKQWESLGRPQNDVPPGIPKIPETKGK